MKIKTFFTRFFTWWNGQTFGTQVWTSLYGEFVGEDEFGNRYYRTKGGKIDPSLGFERRWVIYNGITPRPRRSRRHGTAGSITPSTCRRPTKNTGRGRGKSRIAPNPTGTPAAQRPTGSTLAQGRRPKATGDYKAWVPGAKS